MDWDDLRYFLAVAREQSLASASRALRVSSATVMRRVGALEEALGVRLFTHHRRGYTLTAAGEELRAQAGRVEEELGTLERTLTGRDTRLSGTVRLATSEALAAWLVTPALPAFHRQHPDIRVELALGLRTVGLTRREADLALRLVRPAQADLVVRRMGTMGFAVYGPAGSRAPRRFSLDEHPLVGWDAAFSNLPPARWLAREARGRAPRLTADSVHVQAAAVRAGLGVAVLPCYQGDAEPGLQRLSGPLPVFHQELWLVQLPELRHAARVRAFADFLVRCVEEAAPVLAGERPSAPGRRVGKGPSPRRRLSP